MDDAADYMVQITNDAGSAKSNGNAAVDEKPTIVRGLKDGEVDVGDDHVLSVEVSGCPRTVKWFVCVANGHILPYCCL